MTAAYVIFERYTKAFNAVEALFWITIGIVFMIVACLPKTRLRGLSILVAMLFICFGCTDFFEVKTGSWWEPWWLLAWKSFCVLGLLLCFFWYVRLRRKV